MVEEATDIAIDTSSDRKTAEVILRERRVTEVAKLEAVARQQAVDAQREAYMESGRCIELRAQIVTEQRRALERLEVANFPDGVLANIVTGYYQIHHGWRKKKYYHEQTTVERACWQLPMLHGCVIYCLASDGELYTERDAHESYRNYEGQVWSGLHNFPLHELESLALENILKDLQKLGTEA